MVNPRSIEKEEKFWVIRWFPSETKEYIEKIKAKEGGFWYEFDQEQFCFVRDEELEPGEEENDDCCYMWNHGSSWLITRKEPTDEEMKMFHRLRD